MSSAIYVRIIKAESLRFLEEGSSAPGKSGAKVRPRGVADAHIGGNSVTVEVFKQRDTEEVSDPGDGSPGRKGPKLSREALMETGEKSSVDTRCPYRKPTQVGRKRILRPTGEVLLRNSAS